MPQGWEGGPHRIPQSGTQAPLELEPGPLLWNFLLNYFHQVDSLVSAPAGWKGFRFTGAMTRGRGRHDFAGSSPFPGAQSDPDTAALLGRALPLAAVPSLGPRPAAQPGSGPGLPATPHRVSPTPISRRWTSGLRREGEEEEGRRSPAPMGQG